MDIAHGPLVQQFALALSLLIAAPAFAQPCTREPGDGLATLLGDLGPALTCGPIRTDEIPLADWTFYVHMAADNDLASFALTDIREMTRAGSYAGRTNVFVLADGPGYWGAAKLLWIPPVESRCGPREVIVDGPLARHLAEPNTGDPQVLREALTFLTSRVPSRHLFLDLWNHGAGWRGIGFDNSGDHLDFATDELARAIEGLPVDVIGADACLIATVEIAITARMLKDTGVRALVASQETEPGHGWDYNDLLRRMTGAIDPRRKVPIFDVVSEAVLSYEGTGAETLSATDIPMSEYVLDELGKLSVAVVAAGGFSDNAILRRIYEASLRFGDSRELMDVGDFARRIAASHDGELRTRALALSSALSSATVHGTGMGGRYADARGLSVYAPQGAVDGQYLTAPWLDRLSDWSKAIGTYSATPRAGFEVPAWARSHGRTDGTLPHSSTSWSDRRRQPIALTWSIASSEGGNLVMRYGGHSTPGGPRIARAIVDHEAKTVRIHLQPVVEPGAFDGNHSVKFTTDVSYAPPGDGVWTVVLEYAGTVLGRAEWWPGKP